MKLTKKLLPLTGAAALALSGFAMPMAAQAEVSASMSFSNMYLWRGQNVSPNGAQIAGSLDYNNESGLYAGIWTSSEDAGHETDLYVGFGGEAGDFTYDVSYWWYMYPENNTPADGISDTDAAEIVLSGGYGPVSLAFYMQVDSDNDDDNYITIGYSQDKMSLTYGMWDCEDANVCNSGAGEYSHLTFGYAATDDLSFEISKAMEDNTDGIEEDPLFRVTYSKSFDLMAK